MIIYIVYVHGGEWEDAYNIPIKYFSYLQDACKYVDYKESFEDPQDDYREKYYIEEQYVMEKGESFDGF